MTVYIIRELLQTVVRALLLVVIFFLLVQYHLNSGR